MFTIFEASQTHPDTPQSVGLLWTSDQPDAGTSTWQHTTLSIDRHQSLGGFRKRYPSKRAAAYPRLARPLSSATLIFTSLNFLLSGYFNSHWICVYK